MAPRTDSKFLSSTLDIQPPCCISTASSEKDVYTAAVPGLLNSDPAKSQFMEMSTLSLPAGLSTSVDIRTEAVDARLRRLTARCRLTEKRALLILSKLKSKSCFRPSFVTESNPASEENLSENTESSSDDDEFATPITRSSKSAMPLPLKHPRCREVDHAGCILCCPAFQSARNTSDFPYRRRDDIASQSLALDFYHPNVSDGSHHRAFDFKPISNQEIQNSKDSRRADYLRVVKSAGREVPSAMILHRKSQSKENASASSSRSTSSQDSHFNNHFRKCVPPNTKNGRHVPIWRINPKDPRIPPSPASISSDVFSMEAPREIVVPQWRKMLPDRITPSILSRHNSSATAAVGHNLVSYCSMGPFSSAPPPCTYEAIPLDSGVVEDTSDEHYQELHAVEEVNELRRKTGPPHDPFSPHSPAFHTLSD
ncbi:unnamed protein product [Schistocephalus solidus]|uniref:Expressed conserved protein n=1 Tax=Schistocephalus solidus TaxID=70667 RepID=A0A183SS54_SCHSO|nr:unnamed protein product [Schistocephalus solidus]